MAKKEANFDLYIYELLKEANINADTQGSTIKEINEALKTASKKQTGSVGFPEYVALVKDFVLVMEDKPTRAALCLCDGDKIDLTTEAAQNYAVNGALFYAKKIIEQTNFNKALLLVMQEIESIIFYSLFLYLTVGTKNCPKLKHLKILTLKT